MVSLMPQKLKSIDFDYTNPSRWEYYFRGKTYEMVENGKKIIEFWRELKRKCDGLPFDKLQESWDYSRVLLGGVSQEGIYEDRSLAQIYRDIFGLKIEKINKLIELQRQGISPSTTVVVEETEFISFVKKVIEKGKEILSLAETNDIISDRYTKIDEVEYDYFDILSDEDELIDLLSDFADSFIRTLPNNNERALALWTLDMNTYRYLCIAYPKLKESGVEPLSNLFGLNEIFSPQIKENSEEASKIRENYRVFSYTEGSLGREIISLYQYIWEETRNGIRDDLTKIFPDFPNLMKDFQERSEKKLKRIGWEEPDIKMKYDNPKYSGPKGNRHRAEYQINEIMLETCKWSYTSTTGNSNRQEKDCDLSLLKVLDDLSPGLFLLHRLKYKMDIDDESLELEKEKK